MITFFRLKRKYKEYTADIYVLAMSDEYTNNLGVVRIRKRMIRGLEEKRQDIQENLARNYNSLIYKLLGRIYE